MSDFEANHVNGNSTVNGEEANGEHVNGNNVNGNHVGPKGEDLAKAREAGWTERTAFDYGGNDSGSGDWAGAAKVYEWSDSYGEVGPEVPELEKILFGGEFVMRRGDSINNLELEVHIEGPTKIAPVRKVIPS